jgi:hypothetical protein
MSFSFLSQNILLRTPFPDKLNLCSYFNARIYQKQHYFMLNNCELLLMLVDPRWPSVQLNKLLSHFVTQACLLAPICFQKICAYCWSRWVRCPILYALSGDHCNNTEAPARKSHSLFPRSSISVAFLSLSVSLYHP